MTEAYPILKELATFGDTLGLLGILIYMWFWNAKEQRKWQEGFMAEQKKWEDRFLAVKKMYESNVYLVKEYERMSSNQHNTIVLAIQILQKLSDQISQNQYCPRVRLEKKTVDIG